MSDLNEALSSGSTKVIGSSSSGIETNYLGIDSLGRITANIASSAIATDAFGRQRVSVPEPVFYSTFTYDLQPNVFSSAVTGTGSLTSQTVKSSALLATTGSGVGSAIIQTKRNFQYHPGTSRMVLFTGYLSNSANTVCRYGPFDANDGMFFETNNGTLYVTIRSSTSGSIVDTKIAQSSWNLDKLDGTGTSGVTLDITKHQVFWIDYGWLGSKGVRFGFILNGTLVYCHQFDATNSVQAPFLSTGHLPVRAEITTSASVASSMLITCMAVYDENGGTSAKINGVQRAVDTSSVNNKNLSATTLTPVLSIRLNSANPKSLIIPKEYSLIVGGGLTWANVRLILNGTLTGASFSSVSNSICQYDQSATAISGGINIHSHFTGPGTALNEQVSMPDDRIILSYDDLNATSDVLTICAYGDKAGSALAAAITWVEE